MSARAMKYWIAACALFWALVLSLAADAQIYSPIVNGGGFSAASPPAIGGTTPAAGTFTTLTATTALKTNQSATATFQYGATANDQVAMNATGTFFGQTNAGGTKYQLVLGSAPLVRFASDTVIAINSTTTLSSGALDTGIARNAAAMVEINNGTAGTIGDLKVRRINGSQATAPTCTSNCGTSPSIVGSDTSMIVTMGASGVPASGWVVTFNGTWAAAPSCVVQSALTTMVVGKMPIAVQTGTTTITVTTNGTAPATSDKYAIHCMGVS